MLFKLVSHARRNAVAYLALFVAMGGTAVAAKPLLTGADIQDDSLAGTDILESSLAKVPNADTLDGLDSTGFVQGTGKVQRFYTSEAAESSDINHDFDGGIAHLSLNCLKADGAPPTAGLHGDVTNTSGGPISLWRERVTANAAGDAADTLVFDTLPANDIRPVYIADRIVPARRFTIQAANATASVTWEGWANVTGTTCTLHVKQTTQ